MHPFRLSNNGNGHTSTTEGLEPEVPEPPSATGQWPAPIWGGVPATTAAHEAGSLTSEEVPDPPGATGQYPEPIWGAAAAPSLASAADTEAPGPADVVGECPAPLRTEGKADPFAESSLEAITQEAAPSLPVSLKDPAYSEAVAGDLPVEAPPMLPNVALTNEAIYRIVREVAESDSGEALYAAVSADREFETVGHPSYRRRHFGLAFGFLLFTQESGRLGRVLHLMKQRDPGAFTEAFGADADTLLAVANASTPVERLQPVGGEPLWSAKWIERFKRAGGVPACRYAQNEEAIEGLFRPVLRIAAPLGLTSDRGLAMAFDRVVVQGIGGGLRWIIQAAGPLRTSIQRSHALHRLGHRDVGEFQAATPGLPRDGRLGIDTYAALVAALRRQGEVPLPSPHEYVCRLVTSAVGPARRRLERLRDSVVLTDQVFDLS